MSVVLLVNTCSLVDVKRARAVLSCGDMSMEFMHIDINLYPLNKKSCKRIPSYTTLRCEDNRKRILSAIKDKKVVAAWGSQCDNIGGYITEVMMDILYDHDVFVFGMNHKGDPVSPYCASKMPNLMLIKRKGEKYERQKDNRPQET